MDFPSPDHSHRHLDANAGREVVYCHACSNEWYRDERGLQCPGCYSDITEIVRWTPSSHFPARCAFGLI